MSRYQDLQRSLEGARARFSGYHSECSFFAAQLIRGLGEYSGWPRELLAFERLGGGEGAGEPAARVEDAMHLDEDGFWHVGLRLALEEPKGRDSILLVIRFKKLEARYVVSPFGSEDFEVPAPTPEALQPIYDSILNAVKRHYEDGLRLFLDNGGRGLKIQISARRLQDMAKGAGGA
jgi:hypothetical protein